MNLKESGLEGTEGDSSQGVDSKPQGQGPGESSVCTAADLGVLENFHPLSPLVLQMNANVLILVEPWSMLRPTADTSQLVTRTGSVGFADRTQTVNEKEMVLSRFGG